VVRSRADLSETKRVYAHDHAPLADLLSAVEALRPTALIGVAGKPGMFTPPVLSAMARINERPIVFAMSNPTSKQECTAEEAYAGTEGRALFASGSPSAPLTVGGKFTVPGQGNNAYIFPGVGLAVVACGITRVTDEMFLAAARTLSRQVTEEDRGRGSLYPPLARIREVSAKIAKAVAETAYRQGLAAEPQPADLHAHILSHMYDPVYPDYA
jgi:malate dehydrogenase (oxaloacetate-decarboxylating)(NADP+)